MRLRELIIGIVVATGTWSVDAAAQAPQGRVLQNRLAAWKNDVTTSGRTP
jgi:hypothetical protein